MAATFTEAGGILRTAWGEAFVVSADRRLAWPALLTEDGAGELSLLVDGGASADQAKAWYSHRPELLEVYHWLNSAAAAEPYQARAVASGAQTKGGCDAGADQGDG